MLVHFSVLQRFLLRRIFLFLLILIFWSTFYRWRLLCFETFVNRCTPSSTYFDEWRIWWAPSRNLLYSLFSSFLTAFQKHLNEVRLIFTPQLIHFFYVFVLWRLFIKGSLWPICRNFVLVFYFSLCCWAIWPQSLFNFSYCFHMSWRLFVWWLPCFYLKS